MTLAEFRKRYPQYDDMPDGELAGRLHRKHYIELTFEEFARRIGYTPPGFDHLNVPERRWRKALSLAHPRSLLIFAGIISVFLALRLIPQHFKTNATPATDVFPVFRAVSSAKRDATLEFSPSNMLRPPLIAATPTSPVMPGEQEAARETMKIQTPSQATAVASRKTPPEAERTESSAVPVPAAPRHAPSSSPPVSKAVAASQGARSADSPSGKTFTTSAPPQKPMPRAPMVAATPQSAVTPTKRKAERREIKTQKPSQAAAVPSPSESKTGSDPAAKKRIPEIQVAQSAEARSGKASSTSAPTQEPALRPAIPRGSSKIPERESLPEEWIPTHRPIPRDTKKAPRAHAAAANPAPPTARPSNRVGGQTPPKAGNPLFPAPGRLVAAVPATPSGTPSESNGELGTGKLSVRLEGPRPWVTEREVETVSGIIVSGLPVRLVLYVNGTGREVVPEGDSFRATVSLSPGLNRLRVVATDWRGAASEDAITVEYVHSKVPQAISITSPPDGYTLTPDGPPVILVEGEVKDQNVQTVWLFVNGRRIAVQASNGRFRKALPVLETNLRLWAELPRDGKPPRRSRKLTVHAAPPSPSVGLLLINWPKGVTGNDVELTATWRASPERLDSPVQRVQLKAFGTSLNGTPPEVFTIRPLKPGVYTFVLQARDIWASDVRPTLYLPQAGHLNGRNLKSFSLMGTGKVVLARVLLPQGVFWDQDDWFTGQSISASITTKFRLPDGIVWREREGNIQ